jgi:hypothetical protein
VEVLLVLSGDRHVERAIHLCFAGYRVNRWEERFYPREALMEAIDRPLLLLMHLGSVAPEIERERAAADAKEREIAERLERREAEHPNPILVRLHALFELQRKRGDWSLTYADLAENGRPDATDREALHE